MRTDLASKSRFCHHRYYRLMSMDVECRGTDAERSSLAFKTVAEVTDVGALKAVGVHIS